MVTKGVASVRSPVRNLHDFGAKVTHDDFVDAVVESFQSEYQLSDDASPYEKPLTTISLTTIPRSKLLGVTAKKAYRCFKKGFRS